MSFKVEGRSLHKYDEKHFKWNVCGTILTEDDGSLIYVTRKREILYKHRSLGVSEDILDFLLSLPQSVLVRFVLGAQQPFQVYSISANTLKREGIAVKTENDGEEQISYHLPLYRLLKAGQVSRPQPHNVSLTDFTGEG